MLAGGEAEVKGGALTGLPFRPDSAAVTQNDSPHIGESNACALKFRAMVQSLKGTKQLCSHLRIKAHAVIADQDNPFVGGLI